MQLLSHFQFSSLSSPLFSFYRQGKVQLRWQASWFPVHGRCPQVQLGSAGVGIRCQCCQVGSFLTSIFRRTQLLGCAHDPAFMFDKPVRWQCWLRRKEDGQIPSKISMEVNVEQSKKKMCLSLTAPQNSISLLHWESSLSSLPESSAWDSLRK